jgi:hypothetical protein
MADERPRDPDNPQEPGDLPQHDFVGRMRPDPAQPAARAMVLAGLLGDSDRAGYRRLYFSRTLDYYAEFRAEDVLFPEPVTADQPPLVGLEATRVGIRRDAPVEFTRTTAARPADEFDLDIRLGPRPRAAMRPLLPAETWEAECPGPTWGDCPTDITCVCGDTVQITICRGATCIEVCETRITCDTCRTECGQATCQTCRTRCGQPTCAATCVTCPTACNQATCVTCQTACDQATCQTCKTDCGRTCVTCDTCNPHVFTCGPNPQCF